jgi:hypothetical protein
MDLAFDIELITFDQNVITFDQSYDSLFVKILNNWLESFLIADVILRAELVHVLTLTLKSWLDLVDVKKSLFLNFTCVRS